MSELTQSLNWSELIVTLWTVIILPLLTYAAKQAYDFLQSRKLDKYAALLYACILSSVKDVYETIVKDIKPTDQWTEDKQAEVREIAKVKAVNALSQTAYHCLKQANPDFEEWLDSMIGTALYDIKHSPQQ